MFQVSPWQFVFHTRIDVTREYLTTNTNKSVEAEPSISALVTTDYHSFLLFEILLYYPLKRVRINRFILFIRHFLSYALDNFFSQNLFLINLNPLIVINNENMYMTIILFHYFFHFSIFPFFSTLIRRIIVMKSKFSFLSSQNRQKRKIRSL